MTDRFGDVIVRTDKKGACCVRRVSVLAFAAIDLSDIASAELVDLQNELAVG